MRRTRTAGVLEHQPASVRTKLAAAWTSLVLLYVYVDVLSLYKPGVIDDILVGVVWKLTITQTWAVGALTLMAIPIAMVVLCGLLPLLPPVHLLDRGLRPCGDTGATPPPHAEVEESR